MLDILPPTFIPRHGSPQLEAKKVVLVMEEDQRGEDVLPTLPAIETPEEGTDVPAETPEEGTDVPAETPEEGTDAPTETPEEAEKQGELSTKHKNSFQTIFVEDPEYTSMSIKELRELCSKRSLPSQGKKSVLIDRLLDREGVDL
jgi:hypothetical protein